jgi:hypothetical protein
VPPGLGLAALPHPSRPSIGRVGHGVEALTRYFGKPGVATDGDDEVVVLGLYPRYGREGARYVVIAVRSPPFVSCRLRHALSYRTFNNGLRSAPPNSLLCGAAHLQRKSPIPPVAPAPTVWRGHSANLPILATWREAWTLTIAIMLARLTS